MAVGSPATVAAQGQQFHHQIAVEDRSLQEVIRLHNQNLGGSVAHRDRGTVELITDQCHFTDQLIGTNVSDHLWRATFIAVLNFQFARLH